MAKRRSTRRKRATPKRRLYRSRTGTRRGQTRRTARKAYVGLPRRRGRRRSNPRGKILGTPAFRYGASAVGGAIIGGYVDANSGEGQMFSALRPAFLPAQVSPSVVAALLTYGLAAFMIKGARNRQTAVALGTGMLLPAAAGLVAGTMNQVETATTTSAAFMGGGRRPVASNPPRFAGQTVRRWGLPGHRLVDWERAAGYSSANTFVSDLIPG